jgi:hypothetical protein
MNLTNLTPETVARLSAVPGPTTYNWAVRELANMREQLATVRAMYSNLMYLNDEKGFEITLRSSFNPAKFVTLNDHILAGDVIEPIMNTLNNREHQLVKQILNTLLLMQDPSGDHQEDINCPTTKDRLEILRLVLTPEEYAAITAPAPMCAPEPPTIPMTAAQPATRQQAA